MVNEECACLVDDGLNPEVVISANDSDKDASTILKSIRIKNLKNVIVGQLNINSLRYKFHDLVELIHGNIDIMVLTETKLDGTFPVKQFLMPGYKQVDMSGPRV